MAAKKTPTPIPERPRSNTKKTTNTLRSNVNANKKKSTNTLRSSSSPRITANFKDGAVAVPSPKITTEIGSPGVVIPTKINLQEAAANRLATGGADYSPAPYGSESASPAPIARAIATPETIAPAATPVPASPQMVIGESSGQGAGGGTFNTVGNSGRGATLGMLQRLRNSRSPRTGMSLTPEILRRLAAQRISRQ